MPKTFIHFAKVAKFLLIWSYCSQIMATCCLAGWLRESWKATFCDRNGLDEEEEVILWSRSWNKITYATGRQLIETQCYWKRRFAIPRFWQMQTLHGKLVFPIKWCHEGAQNFQPKSSIFSTKKLHFWAPLWHHLMGKTSFPWSACVCQNLGIANLLFQ